MEDAVILENGGSGLIVPLSKVSDNTTFDPFDPEMLFFDNGRVRRFKKGSTAYMALFDANTKVFQGYFEEIKFWENNKASVDKKTTFASKSSRGRRFQDVITFFEIPDDTKVYINHKLVSQDTTNFALAVNYKFKLIQNQEPLTFEGPGELKVERKLINTDNDNQLSKYGSYIIDKKYLLPDGITLKELDQQAKEVVFDILYVFNEVLNDEKLIDFLEDEGVWSIFLAHFELPQRYESVSETVDYPYHSVYNEEFFSRFRLKLIEFRYWLINYKTDYTKISSIDLFVYIINIFPSIELSYLPYLKKVSLLKGLIDNNTWIIGDWYFNALNEETAIVKIIRSIKKTNADGTVNDEEINNFLIYLNTVYDFSSNNTLFEILYRKVNDAVFFGDDGTGARGQLVKAIYSLWSLSKYNPYRLDSTKTEEEVLNEALDHFTYSETPAFIVKDVGVGVQLADIKAAPMLLDYESKNVLLWNLNDFYFEFEDDKIVVNKDMVTGFIITNSGNTIDTISKKLYGTYNVLQPIAIGKSEFNSNNEYLVKMPFKPVDGETLDINDPNTDFLNNCFPIFYLKYLDDVASISNSKESLGLALDVALTFTGVGNIPKLRHLKLGGNILSKWYKLGSFTSLTTKEQFVVRKLALQIIGTADLFVSGIHILFRVFTAGCTVYHNPSSGNIEPVPQKPELNDPDYATKLEAYDQYQYCKSVDNFLTATEIFLLVGTLRASRNVKKAAANLKSKKPSNLPTVDPEANKFIDDLVVNLGKFVDDFLDRIKNDYKNLSKWINNIRVSASDLVFDLILILDDLPQSVLSGLNQLPVNVLEDTIISTLKLLEEIREIRFLERVQKLFNSPYEVKALTSLLSSRQAFQKYGAAGRDVVNKVRDVVADTPIALRGEKVMVSGMIYRSDNYVSPIFTFSNFTKSEKGKKGLDGRWLLKNGEDSKYQEFLDDIDPIIQRRIDIYIEKEANNLVNSVNSININATTAKEIARAGEIASHGEIRSLDSLIKHLKKPVSEGGGGIDITDEMLSSILAYNRSMFLKKQDFTMHTCIKCHFLTDLIIFMRP